MRSQRQNFTFWFHTIQHVKAVWFRVKVFYQCSDCTSRHTLLWRAVQQHYKSLLFACMITLGERYSFWVEQYGISNGATVKVHLFHKLRFWFLITKAFHLTLWLFRVRNRAILVKDFDPDKWNKNEGIFYSRLLSWGLRLLVQTNGLKHNKAHLFLWYIWPCESMDTDEMFLKRLFLWNLFVYLYLFIYLITVKKKWTNTWISSKSRVLSAHHHSVKSGCNNGKWKIFPNTPHFKRTWN